MNILYVETFDSLNFNTTYHFSAYPKALSLFQLAFGETILQTQ